MWYYLIKNALDRWNSRSSVTSNNSFSCDEIKARRDTNTIVDYLTKYNLIFIIFQIRLYLKLNKAAITVMRISYSMTSIEYVTIIDAIDRRMKNKKE